MAQCVLKQRVDALGDGLAVGVDAQPVGANQVAGDVHLDDRLGRHAIDPRARIKPEVLAVDEDVVHVEQELGAGALEDLHHEVGLGEGVVPHGGVVAHVLDGGGQPQHADVSHHGDGLGHGQRVARRDVRQEDGPGAEAGREEHHDRTPGLQQQQTRELAQLRLARGAHPALKEGFPEGLTEGLSIMIALVIIFVVNSGNNYMSEL